MMMEVRLRDKVDPKVVTAVKGRIVRDEHYNVLLTGPCKILMPGEGPTQKLLGIYLPGAVKEEMDASYDVLTKIRGRTDNRGLASGTERVRGNGINRTRARGIQSSILGAFDPAGAQRYCRLTSFTARQNGSWRELFPLFQAVARHFENHVPDRYRNQVRYASETKDDWLIPDTPFTTITVNNTYPTGVHKDKGDLDSGFSCLATARRGEFEGGRLVFPEWRVAVDMKDGDLMLMQAHEWHGNTAMRCSCEDKQELVTLGEPCKGCGAERISVVHYYRTKMKQCGTLEEESSKQAAHREKDFV